LLIGLVVGIAQQVTGVNAIYFYAATIFEQSGVGTNAAFMQAIWIGLINIIFTLIAMTFIDKLGRKPLLVMGLAGVIISMSICAYGFKQATYELTPATVAKLSVNVEQQDLQAIIGVTYDNDLDYKEALIENLGQESYNANQAQLIQAAAKMNAVLIMVGILGFVASFAVSLGPVMWVLFSEIFPNQIRGVAISFVGAINSLASFGVQLVFPWELANLGAAMTFLVYGGFAVIGLVFVVFVMPETKGKSLEELEKQLGTN
jgi:MFS family permease